MTVIRSAIDAAVQAAVKSSKKTAPRLSRHLTTSLWSAALVLGLGAAAQAQEKPADETSAQQSGGTLEEITVTGSRIKRTNDFNTPTPTTVIDTAAMENMGMVNIGETLQLTPANASTFTPANTGNSPYFIGAYIPDLRGLNPYFGSRTLTLVDGQRFVQTEQGDQIDLNFIPQILVDRIDVVTGGASAAYGSGAIAGVENIILNNKLEGGKITGDWFETSHSDAKDRHIGAAYGHGLFEDKVHFVIGGEMEHQDSLGCQDARAWCAQDQGAYQSPAGSSVYQYGSGLRQTTSPYGLFLSPVATSTTFQGNPIGNGTQTFNLPANYGTYGSFNDVMPSGDGVPIYQYSNLMAPVSRGVITLLLNGAITDSLHWKASAYYGKTQTTNFQQTVTSQFQSISPDNAYIQGNPSLVSAVGPGAFINKDWSTQEPAFSQFTTNVRRVTFGLDGKFGNSTWTWDANYEYGLTHHDQLLQNNLHFYEADMALDTVMVNGVPQCRVTAYGFAAAVAQNPGGGYAGANPSLANGCVPLNPFGNQPISAAAAAYAFGNLVENLRYAQTDANINASGELFDGIGAGAFTAAVGYEYRQEVGQNIDNPGVSAAVAQDYLTQFGTSFGGTVSVHEGYLELNAPLMKDKAGAHLLEVDLAGRQSRYINRAQFGINTSTPGVEGNDFDHNLTTWKGSVIWEPLEGVRFRASQSRDARAANFRELYYGQVIGAGGLFGYCGPGGTFVDPCTWNLEGNVNLKPETSDTTTAGIVLTPTDFLQGLQFSADYFHIKINNAIEQANPTLVEDQCRNGLAAACSQMSFEPGTGGAAAYQAGAYNVATLTPTSYNGAFYEVKGVDFSLVYDFDAGPFGRFTPRLLTTWYDEQEFANCTLGAANGCYTFNILGQTGSGNGFLNDYTPDARWKGNLMVTWTQGPISITPSMNFVSHGVMDYLGVTPSSPLYNELLNNSTTGKPGGPPLPSSITNAGYHLMSSNYVPSYFLFNLNGTYTFKDGPASGLQVFAQVNNVFNKQPPFTGGATAFGPSNSYGGTNPIYFDALGLAYRVGFRYNF
jgi:iron complex outermembrane receptor protein